MASVGHRFQPGVSGNPKGRRPFVSFDDRLREYLRANRGEKAKALVQKLVERGLQGHLLALKLICDRVDGPPREATSAPSEAVTLEKVREQLAALLANPDVRRNLESLMKQEQDAIQ